MPHYNFDQLLDEISSQNLVVSKCLRPWREGKVSREEAIQNALSELVKGYEFWKSAFLAPNFNTNLSAVSRYTINQYTAQRYPGLIDCFNPFDPAKFLAYNLLEPELKLGFLDDITVDLSNAHFQCCWENKNVGLTVIEVKF